MGVLDEASDLGELVVGVVLGVIEGIVDRQFVVGAEVLAGAVAVVVEEKEEEEEEEVGACVVLDEVDVWLSVVDKGDDV